MLISGGEDSQIHAWRCRADDMMGERPDAMDVDLPMKRGHAVDRQDTTMSMVSEGSVLFPFRVVLICDFWNAFPAQSPKRVRVDVQSREKKIARSRPS